MQKIIPERLGGRKPDTADYLTCMYIRNTTRRVDTGRTNSTASAGKGLFTLLGVLNFALLTGCFVQWIR